MRLYLCFQAQIPYIAIVYMLFHNIMRKDNKNNS
jgi:hypothetical protein